MHHPVSYYTLISLDVLLSVSLGIIFRTGERKFIWKTVSNFAFLRVAAAVCVLAVLTLLSHYPSSGMRTAYFVTYYAFYLALTVVSFKLFYEIYRKATVAFPGFSRMGHSIFAWVLIIMFVLTFMNLGSANSGQDAIARAAINMVRAIETVSICVIAFLVYLIRSMGLSWRNKVFGIMAGFMIGSLSSLIQDLQYQFHMEMSPAMTLFYQFSGVAGLLIWIAYAFLPEPLPRPVTLPAESPVYRWSQIASALGTKTQVAVPEPQHSFFLADVEKVVDKVFTRHMQETTDSAS